MKIWQLRILFDDGSSPQPNAESDLFVYSFSTEHNAKTAFEFMKRRFDSICNIGEGSSLFEQEIDYDIYNVWDRNEDMNNE